MSLQFILTLFLAGGMPEVLVGRDLSVFVAVNHTYETRIRLNE